MIDKVKGICRENVEDLKNKVVILENCLQERKNLIVELEDIIKLFDNEEQFVSNLTPMETFDILRKIGYEDENEMTNIYVEMIKEIQSSPKENSDSSLDNNKGITVEENIQVTNNNNNDNDNNDDDEISFSDLNIVNNLDDNDVKSELIGKIDDTTTDLYINTDNKEELKLGNEKIVNHFIKLFDSNFISDDKSYFIKNNRINKELLINNLKKIFNTDFEVENVMDMLCEACTNGMNFDENEVAEIREELENITV